MRQRNFVRDTRRGKARSLRSVESQYLVGSKFYYKLAELRTIAEELGCPTPVKVVTLVAPAYRAAEETKRIGGKDLLLGEIIYD
jgi:hypothetical protein